MAGFSLRLSISSCEQKAHILAVSWKNLKDTGDKDVDIMKYMGQIYIFSNIIWQTCIILDQEVERECENVLAWKACIGKSLDLWCCGTNHQNIQEGYPKTFLSDLWSTDNTDRTARPFLCERTGTLLFLRPFCSLIWSAVY